MGPKSGGPGGGPSSPMTPWSRSAGLFDEIEARLTRDLHCFTGSISYNKLTDDIQLVIGLKAFPSVQTDFGTTHGARTGGGEGTYY